MKTIILSGFLGSGKTTVILQLARYLVGNEQKKNKVVILENEIGEVGVDDMLLRGNGYEVSELFSGCACCSMAGELRGNVRILMRDLDPEWLIVEATGLAYPDRIKETLDPITGQPCVICTIVDAKRFLRILRPAEDLVAGQLESADLVLVNKIDLVSEETLQDVEAAVRERCRKAAVERVSGLAPIDPSVWNTLTGAFGEEG